MHNIRPVSYTHLDVYKRQLIPCVAFPHIINNICNLQQKLALHLLQKAEPKWHFELHKTFCFTHLHFCDTFFADTLRKPLTLDLLTVDCSFAHERSRLVLSVCPGSAITLFWHTKSIILN